MKATKHTFSVVVTVLHPDAIPGRLAAVVEQLERENPSGKLISEDGDKVKWKTEKVDVEF